MAKRKLSYENIIQLLGVYESEFECRSNLLWNNTFKLSFIVDITILLPFIKGYFEVEMPDIDMSIFPIAGVTMAFAVLILDFLYCEKIKAITDTIIKVLDYLPQEYRRIKVNKRVKIRTSYFLSIIIFIFQCILGIFTLILL